jgi:hypothetical protein
LNGTKDAPPNQVKLPPAARLTGAIGLGVLGNFFPLDFRGAGFHNGNRFRSVPND